MTLQTWLDRSERRLRKARILLQPAVEGCNGAWADLGCGDGIFTYLLCTFLAAGSTVYAVDQDRPALAGLVHNLGAELHRTRIRPLHADFTRSLPLPPLAGIVMANSLHFVRRKAAVLRRLHDLLTPGGRLVVIEYNTNRGNWAVPHPLDEARFLDLAVTAGFQDSHIAARAPSSFLSEMYTGIAHTPQAQQATG